MRNEDDEFNLVESLERGFDRVFEYLPQIIGALLILVVGYLIAITLRKVVQSALRQFGFDRMLHSSAAGKQLEQIMQSPSWLLSRVVFWFVWIGFISLAVSALNLPALNSLVGAVYGYLPNVIAAIAIFLVASAISAGAAAFVSRIMGDTTTANLIKTVIPGLTMSIAVFMILNQLQIATDIVNVTYTAIIGSLALGLALAFGLGGRDLAARILEDAYGRGQQNSDRLRSEAKYAQGNIRKEMRRARQGMRNNGNGSTPPMP